MTKNLLTSFLILGILFSLSFFLKPGFGLAETELNYPFSQPIQILTSPKTDLLFILNRGSNELTVFDAKERKALANLPTGERGSAAFMTSDTSGNLLVLNQNSGYLTFFPLLGQKEDFSRESVDQLTKERKFFPAGSSPYALSGDPELRKIYVLSGPETLLILERETNKITAKKAGQAMSKLIVNPETHKVYLVGRDVILVIDGKTDEFINTISIGNFLFDLKLSKDNRIFVSSSADDKIYVIDGGTDEVLASINSEGDDARGLGLNNTLQKLYVSNWLDASLTVIDARNYKFLKKIFLPAGAYPGEPLVDEASNLIFVSNTGLNSVSIIDAKKDEIISTLEVGVNPGKPVLSRSGEEIYIPNFQSDSLSILSKNSQGQFQEQTVPEQKGIVSKSKNFSYPFKLAVNEENNEVYVLNNLAGNFLILDAKSYKIKDRILVGQNPWDILFVPALSKIFVTNGDNDNITRYSLQDRTQKNIAVGDKPINLLFNPLTQKLYTLNYNSRDVSVVDAKEEIHLLDIPIGGRPQAIALNSKENKIYVADLSNNELVVIDGQTDQILEKTKVGLKPAQLLYDETFNRLYVANTASDELSIIDGSSNQVIRTLTASAYPGFLTLNKVQNKVYLSGGPGTRIINSDSLDITSCDLQSSGKTIVEQKNQKLFVLGRKNILDIINLKDNTPIASLNIFRSAPSLTKLNKGRLEDAVFNSSADKLFVALGGADALAVVDVKKDRLEAVISNEGLEVISYPLPRAIRLVLFIIIIAVFIALIVLILRKFFISKGRLSTA